MDSFILSPPPNETLAPADAAAVAEIVYKAAKEGQSIYPRGGGTHWNYGATPSRPGITLSLENMNRLVDHTADDMTVTVEAGMTFAELAKILATKNQRLPIDVREPEKATLGGLVAVNQAGPRQFGYGTIRDYLLGFTAVDGEGTIFHGGARVVKNAAGYNMNRLMAGSLGTLGILTQLTLMVRPLPELSAIASCELSDLETVEMLLASINKSQVRPVAVELLVDGSRASTRPATLFIGLEGTAAEVHWMLDVLQAEWQTAGVPSPKTVVDADAEKLWQLLADFAADVRIAVRPNQVVELIAALREKYPDCSIQSHAMGGIVLMENGRGKAEGEEYYRQLRSLAESFDGKMTVLSFLENVELSRQDIWGPPANGFAVMHAIKERFDPHNIFNPGRFIFE
jgi:glycolate oxidase FAD binding subunit